MNRFEELKGLKSVLEYYYDVLFFSINENIELINQAASIA